MTTGSQDTGSQGTVQISDVAPGFRPARAVLKDGATPKSGQYGVRDGLTPEKMVSIIGSRSVTREAKLPLYEYACTQCGQHTEKIRKFSDPPLTKCEKCGGRLDQLLCSPAIRFKGSGWYITDYGRKSSPDKSKYSAKSGNGDSDKGSEAAKPDATKKETPATKTSKE